MRSRPGTNSTGVPTTEHTSSRQYSERCCGVVVASVVTTLKTFVYRVYVPAAAVLDVPLQLSTLSPPSLANRIVMVSPSAAVALACP